jgi:hypothetical protein
LLELGGVSGRALSGLRPALVSFAARHSIPRAQAPIAAEEAFGGVRSKSTMSSKSRTRRIDGALAIGFSKQSLARQLGERETFETMK